MPSNHLILCRPLLLLASIFSTIRVFPNRIRWPKYWSFSFSISPSNEYSGLISFRMYWFDCLAVQETLLQHHSSKASILWHSAFFMVQLTSIHDYWKNHSLDYTDLCCQSNVCFIICCLGWSAFLPKSKRLLMSWLQSPSAVILEPKKNKVYHCFHCFPIYLP